MPIVVYSPRGQSENSRIYSETFANGMRAHGHNPQILETWYSTECDLAVWFGWPRSAQQVIDRQFRDGNNFISMDIGYLGDRSKWRSIGYNGQNNRADFLNVDMPANRANRYKWKFKSWNRGTDYVLLLGQVPGDTALHGMVHQAWIEETLVTLEKLTGGQVKYRPHPDPYSPHREQKQSLAADLAGASCVVAYSSNAAVDAILSGIPAILLDEGGMAWPIAGHALEDVLDPPMVDDATRQQWLNNLAYCQWTTKEIASGAAWDHLKDGPKEVNATKGTE